MHVVRSLSTAIAKLLDKNQPPKVIIRTAQRVSRKTTQFYDNEAETLKVKQARHTSWTVGAQ